MKYIDKSIWFFVRLDIGLYGAVFIELDTRAPHPAALQNRFRTADAGGTRAFAAAAANSRATSLSGAPRFLANIAHWWAVRPDRPKCSASAL